MLNFQITVPNLCTSELFVGCIVYETAPSLTIWSANTLDQFPLQVAHPKRNDDFRLSLARKFEVSSYGICRYQLVAPSDQYIRNRTRRMTLPPLYAYGISKRLKLNLTDLSLKHKYCFEADIVGWVGQEHLCGLTIIGWIVCNWTAETYRLHVRDNLFSVTLVGALAICHNINMIKHGKYLS